MTEQTTTLEFEVVSTRLPDGRYVAAGSEHFGFCFLGDNQQEVEDKAQSAIELFVGLVAQGKARTGGACGAVFLPRGFVKLHQSENEQASATPQHHYIKREVAIGAA